MNPAPLALTLGDPAGVGPEIITKAWAELHQGGPAFLVIGDLATLRATAPHLPLQSIDAASEAEAVFPTALPVLDMALHHLVRPGTSDQAAAPAIIGWIKHAVGLALAGEVAALVTAPIAKASLYGAGFDFPGHTEFLGALTEHVEQPGMRGPLMMLAVPGLRTTLVTIHEPLARVSQLLSVEAIVRAGVLTAEALTRDFGIQTPRLVVAALNPHAGEAGNLGTEEQVLISPAVETLKGLGINATGPHPADSLFPPDRRQDYDAAICMYHDQALIPVKMLDFWGGVNVTLGLPVVRTSPDHGTGFDIAGKGIARPDSLIAALNMARQIADRRAA